VELLTSKKKKILLLRSKSFHPFWLHLP
jgi:hypothetical protein